MTEPDPIYEARFERRLRAFAEVPVRPFDADEIAATSVRPRRRLDGLGALLAAALLLALAALWVLTSGGPDSLLPIDARVPSSTPTLVTSAGTSLSELSGPWMADRPRDLSLGVGSPSPRMSLFVDANGRGMFLTLGGGEELIRTESAVEGDVVRLTALAATTEVVQSGTEHRGCTAGEAGRYRATRSSDGLQLTFQTVDDPCPSRALAYARTWVRSLGLPNSGGAGIVDAFDPLFSVTLPPGGYTTDRTTDHLTIVQAVPEFQFLAWKDPQGWNDPCDQSRGRYAIAPGADAFVAYFRQLEGFTVDSTSELLVDGHRAVRLVLHANPDVACPQPVQWQTKAETGDRTWFLRPGDTDSLVIVELADDTTVMFEVLPAPHPEEDQVIGSIRFLEELPTPP
jgi:hypothetical protein